MSYQITSQSINQNFIFNSIKIRVQGSYEEPLFCLADVCKVLALSNPSKVAEQIKEEFETPNLNLGVIESTNNRQLEAIFITEPQLYFVMMRSRAKIAKSFRKWICVKVLPAIRKKGNYFFKSEEKFICPCLKQIENNIQKSFFMDMRSFKSIYRAQAQGFKAGRRFVKFLVYKDHESIYKEFCSFINNLSVIDKINYEIKDAFLNAFVKGIAEDTSKTYKYLYKVIEENLKLKCSV